MLTRLPSSSSPLVAALGSRDAEVTDFARSLIDAGRREWPDRLVSEPDASCNLPRLYTETHYALAAVLLFLIDRSDRGLLDLAARRLRLWKDANGPMTFFNAMAVCLTAFVLRQSGEHHDPLEAVLAALIGDARENRQVGYRLWCGNNAYLQQVAIDMLLLPMARRQEIRPDRVDYLLSEFQKYRTPEGFFYDLPREGTKQEQLCPPTYIMKVLFLLGMCHELHPDRRLAEMFQSGMDAALPLLTRQGHFSYFGRTDNSPFSAGLTIFNLRKAARLSPDRGHEFDAACAAAERYYTTFPRSATGLLQCNRFADAESVAEVRSSRDVYAYIGQYSLSSSAYALLGRFWFPVSDTSRVHQDRPAEVAASKDLGVVRLRTGDSELIVRTASQLTSWDRRYLGPTILRYERGGQLAVGAIAKTVSTDSASRPLHRLHDRFVNGIVQLDGTTVGFLPVLRRGTIDYVPGAVLAQEVSPGVVRTRHQMVRLNTRGYRPLLIELLEVLHRRIPGLQPRQYSRPPIKAAPSFGLRRDVYLTPTGCRIEDCLTGDLHGKKVLFSVRHLPGAVVGVRGLEKGRSATGWSSDGRQILEVYEARGTGSEIRYECDIELANRERR